MGKHLKVFDTIGYSSVVKQASALPQDLRKQVVSAIEDTALEYASEEDSYVRAKIQKKISLTQRSTTSWVVDLAHGFQSLYRWYDAKEAGVDKLEPLWQLSGATLFYFINPFDIIPDHTAATGLVDDAFAFYYCVRQLPATWDSVNGG